MNPDFTLTHLSRKVTQEHLQWICLPFSPPPLDPLKTMNKDHLMMFTEALGLQDAKIEIFSIITTPKTQVVKVIVNNEKSYIYKYNGYPANYYREKLSLLLFKNEKSVPQLIYSSDQSHFLILEYIRENPSLKHLDHLDLIASELGVLHSYPIQQKDFFLHHFPKHTLKHLYDRFDETFIGIANKKLFKKGISAWMELYGEDQTPINLGEFMPKHVLLTSHSRCVFIDWDIFTVGFPDYLDLLGFILFDPDLKKFKKNPWEKLLRSYLTGKFKREITQKEIETTYSILQWTLEALDNNLILLLQPESGMPCRAFRWSYESSPLPLD